MSKLTDVLAQFSKDVARLPPADRDKLYTAIRSSFGPVKSSRTLKTGEVINSRDVDFTAIDDAIPAELRTDWREIKRELNEKSKKLGPGWADESYATILDKYVLPQPTAGDLLVTPDVIAALEKAGFVRNAPST